MDAREVTWTERTTPEEVPIVALCRAWARYADTYTARFDGDLVGTDYVLGLHWLAIGKAIVGLLNGPTGRLDCGTLDAWVRDTVVAQGFDKGLDG